MKCMETSDANIVVFIIITVVVAAIAVGVVV